MEGLHSHPRSPSRSGRSLFARGHPPGRRADYSSPGTAAQTRLRPRNPRLRPGQGNASHTPTKGRRRDRSGRAEGIRRRSRWLSSAAPVGLEPAAKESGTRAGAQVRCRACRQE
ncbi:Uncharacterized protein ToN1_44860 [Aromatoleum petrolei]|nr:Uncharacterized protein ToN1_44860 [Aromatoleum petrolei]